nr:MAG TPA: bacterial mobilization protein [Caudoviricetes sp.]
MEKETRGAKKGRVVNWNVGRKATGLKRNKTISFKVTEKEREFIYEKLDKIGGKRIEALLKILKKN